MNRLNPVPAMTQQMVTSSKKPHLEGFKDDEEDTAKLPNAEYDLKVALRFLHKMTDSDRCVWDLLMTILNKILDFGPDEVTKSQFLTILSAAFQKLETKKQTKWFVEKFEEPVGLFQSQTNMAMIRSMKYKYDPVSRLPDPNTAPDPLTLKKLKLLEEAGIGLSSYESFHFMIALRRFCEEEKVAKARIWGKIYGLKKCYYVIEADPHPDDIKWAAERAKIMNDQAKAAETAQTIEEAITSSLGAVEEFLRGMKEEVVAIKEGIVSTLIGTDQKTEEVQLGAIAIEEPTETVDPIAAQQLLIKYVMPPIPQYVPFKEIVVPVEELGTGVNTKTYYVTNDLSLQFVRLPDIVPVQIVTARCISKFFTGDLEAEVNSFPAFPGKEKHLLRAQIARISAGTYICPLGVYIVPEGEEEVLNEEEMLPGGFIENPDFHPPPIKSLVNSLRTHWTHARQYILPQGRTKYWKPANEDIAEFEFADDWNEDELRGRLGPPILSAISRDDSPDVEKCWSVRRPYRTLGNHNCITVRSNVWPGAAAVTRGFLWENIYIGWGVKHQAQPYSPPPPPPVWIEYEDGPEIHEKTDPTPEEEEAWRERHTPRIPQRVMEGGEGFEGGEGAEE